MIYLQIYTAYRHTRDPVTHWCSPVHARYKEGRGGEAWPQSL